MKKKIILLLLLLVTPFFLSGCSIISNLITIGSMIINNNFGNIDPSDRYPDVDPDDVKTVGDLYYGSLPSIGDSKALVILIEFPNYIHDSKYTVEHMKNMFFGKSDTYQSVASYYYQSSYEKLNLDGDVIGWYKTKSSANNYTRTYDDYASDAILKEAITYYDQQGFDFSKYDSNNDGYIDAVYGIYSRPYDENSNTWWAFQTFYSTSNGTEQYIEVSGVKFSNYVWASCEFLKSDYDNNDITNTSTFIHETGHMFGLDDYYNYRGYYGGGLACADMMDGNVGDHCPISKIILGWVEPIFVDLSTLTTQKYTIGSFTETGQVLLLTPDASKGIFSEYFLVELYTPTGLNESNYFFTKYGIRITHADATIGDGGLDGDYATVFNCDNTDTDHKFITMITPRGEIESSEASNSDLFYSSSTFLSSINKFYGNIDGNFELKISSIATVGKTVEIEITSTK